MKILLTLGLCLLTRLGAAAEPLQELRERALQTHSQAVLVWKDGQTVFEYYSKLGEAPIETMSVTKSVVSLAIGRLYTQGKLDGMGLPLCKIYPEWRQGRKQDITLKHLLTHTSGLQNLPSAQQEINPAPDVVRLALAAELVSNPGEDFSYNNKATNLLAGVIGLVSGQDLETYVREELFAPLGISDYSWARDQAGNPTSMAGLRLQPKDLLKLGILVLNDGIWEGRRLLASEWLQEALSPQAVPGCGYLWWLIPGDIKLVVDEQSLQAFRQVCGPELASQAQALTGTYHSREALEQALQDIFGAQWPNQIELARGIRQHLVRTENFTVRGYLANGYLGQYLVVLPRERVVAVRMIVGSSNYDSKRDLFADFPQMMVKLYSSPSPDR